jgi:predicted 2-oxoglutarate/Fe(II)-dependent dioxygenase YbiX
VFLNSSRARPADEEFSGGELLIFPESSCLRRYAASARQALRIVPRRGSLVAFPSTMLHEVLPVRVGTRDVIVDWFYEVRNRLGQRAKVKGPARYLTSRSSTSKRSVAFGGMTPPAPRAPYPIAGGIVSVR